MHALVRVVKCTTGTTAQFLLRNKLSTSSSRRPRYNRIIPKRHRPEETAVEDSFQMGSTMRASAILAEKAAIEEVATSKQVSDEIKGSPTEIRNEVLADILTHRPHLKSAAFVHNREASANTDTVIESTKHIHEEDSPFTPSEDVSEDTDSILPRHKIAGFQSHLRKLESLKIKKEQYQRARELLSTPDHFRRPRKDAVGVPLPLEVYRSHYVMIADTETEEVAEEEAEVDVEVEIEVENRNKEYSEDSEKADDNSVEKLEFVENTGEVEISNHSSPPHLDQISDDKDAVDIDNNATEATVAAPAAVVEESGEESGEDEPGILRQLARLQYLPPLTSESEVSVEDLKLYIQRRMLEVEYRKLKKSKKGK